MHVTALWAQVVAGLPAVMTARGPIGSAGDALAIGRGGPPTCRQILQDPQGGELAAGEMAAQFTISDP
jgi:hypothetical protein